MTYFLIVANVILAPSQVDAATPSLVDNFMSSHTMTVASPQNVTVIRTIFNDSYWGYRDPTAPVFDGQYWHIWASKIPGQEGGYSGVVWHLYSETLENEWKDGGIAINRSYSDPTSWDSYGVFTPSIAWEGDGGAIVAAPLATKWYLFFGGVSHKQPPFDESIGLAISDSPFGPWEKYVGNPIITGRNPDIPWCDPDGPGPQPGILHVDETEPYVLNDERRLYLKTVCQNHTVLPSVFRPVNTSSWAPPYQYNADIQQPVIPPTVTPSGRGFEQARVFLGPDGRLHMTATAYDGFEPHFVCTDNNIGNTWELVEKMHWGFEGNHELTPVGPPGSGPRNWLGPPGVSGVPEYFIMFTGRPLSIVLLRVTWKNVTLLSTNP